MWVEGGKFKTEMVNGEEPNFVDVEEGLGTVGGEGRQDLIPQLFRRYEAEGLPQYPQAQVRMQLPYMQQMQQMPVTGCPIDKAMSIGRRNSRIL